MISVENCVKMERANLKSYVMDSEEWLLKEVASMELVKTKFLIKIKIFTKIRISFQV